MKYIIAIAVLLFSVIVHEVAHGLVAYMRGDTTAKDLGRLTLNPINHIDIIGSIILPLCLMLVGGPVFFFFFLVPINLLRLKNIRRDMVYVSLAGVTANFILAVIAGILMSAIRNFAPEMSVFASVYIILQYVVIINVVLLIFNLIPIPPLDGSKVVLFLMPRELAQKYAAIERYGFFIILILLATNILWKIIGPIANSLINFLIGTI